MDTAEILAQKDQKIALLEADISRITAELAHLKKLIFGQTRERFIAQGDENQLSLELGEVSTSSAEPQAHQQISYTRKKTSSTQLAHPGRHPLPAHLPVEERIIEPCVDTSTMVKIGEEVSDTLHMQAARFFIRREIRPKYVEPARTKQPTCPQEIESSQAGTLPTTSSVPEVLPTQPRIHIAPLPARPIPRSMAGASLLACILISKYCDHLPLYRQRKIYLREGVDLPGSTLSDWVAAVCELLEPLYLQLRKEVLKQEYLMADESRMPVHDKNGSGKVHKGYQWVYYAPLTKLVLFDYQKGRGKQYPRETLKDFQGYLQTDGYEIYDSLFAHKQGITLLGCMAHARRRFYEALAEDKANASHAMKLFQQLYAIERTAREQNMEPQQRKALRIEKALPLLDQLNSWAKESVGKVVPKSPMGKALAYYLKREKKLRAYTQDGRLEIDNNYVENAIRPLALGRKNYLFAGSHKAAQHTAMIYSFVGSCEKLGIDTRAWLMDVLENIPNTSIQKLHTLLPHNCKPQQQ